jgi:hypothetical protein
MVSILPGIMTLKKMGESTQALVPLERRISKTMEPRIKRTLCSLTFFCKSKGLDKYKPDKIFYCRGDVLEGILEQFKESCWWIKQNLDEVPRIRPRARLLALIGVRRKSPEKRGVGTKNLLCGGRCTLN